MIAPAKIARSAGRPRAGSLLAGPLLAGLLLSSCGDSAPHRSPVLLVTLDTLRADRVGVFAPEGAAASVTPALDALAASGAIFLQASTARGQTLPSLASIMTGLYPSAHGLRENGQRFAFRPVTLAGTLRRAGYRTAAIVGQVPGADPGTPAFGPLLDFEEVSIGAFDLPASQAGDQWAADRLAVDRALAWIANRPKDEPWFLWVHLFGVHRPYSPDPELTRIEVPPLPESMQDLEGLATEEGQDPLDAWLAMHTVEAAPLTPAELEHVHARYRAEVSCVDRLVERLLGAVASSGDAAPLVAVLADHGEELGDHHEYFWHGCSVYQGVLHVPLWIRAPGRIAPGTVVDELVQNVDLLPTLLDWLELPRDPSVEGVSFAPYLADPSTPAPREFAFLEWQDLIDGARDRRFQWISNPLGVAPKKPPYFRRSDRGFPIECEEFYDLEADPGEHHDLAHEGGHEAERARLAAAVAAHRERPARITTWEVGDDPELLARLQALGYVGSLPGRPDVLFGAIHCGADSEGAGAAGDANRER